ncbi:MAG: GSCFA domain-containing protein [Rhodospirillaceae bacterium]|nr:GSCFA domain-containing protein [Rhodospirillaceae bacterium]
MKILDHESWKQEIVESVGKGVKRTIGTTFFRGDGANFMPYQKEYVAEGFFETYVMNGLLPDKKFINASKTITSIGSCFAQNVTKYLTEKSFKMHSSVDSEIYISLMGEGMVNTYAIASQFEWALDGHVPTQNLWHGYKAEEFGYSEDIRRRTGAVFKQSKVFILTLGLSEVWYDEPTGGVFWRAIPMKHYDPARHKFKVATQAENLANLNKIVDIIRKRVPDADILFTLSPIKLAATFRPMSCLTANHTSKANLKSALDQLLQDRSTDKRLHYFPSYEIITELFPHPYKFDNRHIHTNIIDFMMLLFDHFYIDPPSITAEELRNLFVETRWQNCFDSASLFLQFGLDKTVDSLRAEREQNAKRP